jgi:hypothetical protein
MPSTSPKTRKASRTVTTGSTVERMEARVGPTRRRPMKNRLIAATVETTARQANHPQPPAVTSPGRSSPSSVAPAVRLTAAPLQTSADSTLGAIRRAMPSLTRM